MRAVSRPMVSLRQLFHLIARGGRRPLHKLDSPRRAQYHHGTVDEPAVRRSGLPVGLTCPCRPPGSPEINSVRVGGRRGCQTAGAPLADSRNCAHCGTSFAPRREHARFCCVRCRAAWNREHMGDPRTDASALLWSITAMSETTARLAQTATWDRARAYAAVGEAVWWVTLVDATLVRHHPDPYDNVMASQSPARREQIEATLAGLRFVRNRIAGEADLATFIQAAAPGRDPDNGHVTAWTWKPVPPPALASLPPRAQAWEQARYRAYHAQLAGHTLGEVFRRAATFLTLTAANTGALADLASADTYHGPG